MEAKANLSFPHLIYKKGPEALFKWICSKFDKFIKYRFNAEMCSAMFFAYFLLIKGKL